MVFSAMDNRLILRCCRLFVFLGVLFVHSASAKAILLLLATDDTPGNPWIIGGGSHFQKDLPGIEIELYRHVADQLGLELEMVRMPWKRCLFELKTGHIDGIFPASFKPERLEIGVFPFKNGKIDADRSSRVSAYFLYRLKTTSVAWQEGKFVNRENMQRHTIGVPLEWSIAEDLRRMNVDVLERPRPIELLEMLARGGLAGVACLSTVADVYIEKEPQKFGQIEKVYPAIAEKTYFLMLSHQFSAAHPDIAEDIWDTIAVSKTGEVFNSISKRYFE